LIELHSPGFHIVLYQPEIPSNAGNIGRLCVGSDSTLHLIKPFRFLMDDKSLKRAGLDYWPKLDLVLHEGINEVLESVPLDRVWFCTTKSANSYLEAEFHPGDYLIFGPESRGLPEDLLMAYAERCITVPMTGKIRSLNLANAAAIILYEAMRQIQSRA
jgi:tRNA (cytidine/uridine-2'-O-)-methyltransferase